MSINYEHSWHDGEIAKQPEKVSLTYYFRDPRRYVSLQVDCIFAKLDAREIHDSCIIYKNFIVSITIA